ncbi:MAG: PIN domain-containing protein [Bryobacterales bacterium]
MSVLVDTSIWSVALRRHGARLAGVERAAVAEWSALVTEGRACLMGPIRHEILSGIRSNSQFELLKNRLEPFPNQAVLDADYVEAADLFNRCRRQGLSGTPIDLLICAAAIRLNFAVFSLDGDFRNAARLLPLRLHEPRAMLEY